MGAYQDIMGDLHNLFGRVNEVHVFLEPDEPTGYNIEESSKGNTIIQSLAAVQYDENELKRQMKAQIDEAIKSDRMKPSEAMRLLDDYERGLKAYTYLSILRRQRKLLPGQTQDPFDPDQKSRNRDPKRSRTAPLPRTAGAGTFRPCFGDCRRRWSFAPKRCAPTGFGRWLCSRAGRHRAAALRPSGK